MRAFWGASRTCVGRHYQYSGGCPGSLCHVGLASGASARAMRSTRLVALGECLVHRRGWRQKPPTWLYAWLLGLGLLVQKAGLVASPSAHVDLWCAFLRIAKLVRCAMARVHGWGVGAQSAPAAMLRCPACVWRAWAYSNSGAAAPMSVNKPSVCTRCSALVGRLPWGSCESCSRPQSAEAFWACSCFGLGHALGLVGVWGCSGFRCCLRGVQSQLAAQQHRAVDLLSSLALRGDCSRQRAGEMQRIACSAAFARGLI